MKKILLRITITVCSLVAFTSANAEAPISFAFQFGYAAPQGSWFKGEKGEDLSKFGLGGDIDVLYHLEQLDYKLGVGVTYNTSLMFCGDLDYFSDLGFYGLSLYGVKGQWRFFNSTVSPYGALSLGLSQFSTPDYTVNDEVVVKGKSAFSFGIRPEIGVEFGVFFLSASYLIPMKYSIYEASESAGNLQINMGLRFSLFHRDN